MSPREALLMIPGFAHARVDGILADGITSTSWRVENDRGPHVLRIDKPAAAELGLDRAAEAQAQAAVAAAGLTPGAVYHDPGRGVSLRPHFEGRAWTARDLQEPAQLDRLAHLLRDLHALPPAGARYEPGVAARRYARQLGSLEARRLADRANILLAELRYQPARECLCHNDLVAANLVDDGERLVPIDWEYGGIGDPLFDLAVVMEHHDLPAASRGRLIRAYFRQDPPTARLERLAAWGGFYRLLLKLWNLRTADGA